MKNERAFNLGIAFRIGMLSSLHLAYDDDKWVTINGSHVLIDGDTGNVKQGLGGKQLTERNTDYEGKCKVLISSLQEKGCCLITGLDEVSPNARSKILSVVDGFVRKMTPLLGKNFPIAPIGFLKGGTLSDGVLATADFNGFTLDTKAFNDEGYIEELIRKSLEMGWIPPCDESSFYIYPIQHELGHVLFNLASYVFFCSDKNKKELLYSDKEEDAEKACRIGIEYATRLRNDAIALARGLYNKAHGNNISEFDLIQSQMGTYGNSGVIEFLAEGYANSDCGKQNELGNAVKQILFSELKKWN